MNYYAPIGAMQVMGASTSAAGALQMPRTLITIILPTIAGAWVGKKAANAWKAMVIGTSLAMIDGCDGVGNKFRCFDHDLFCSTCSYRYC